MATMTNPPTSPGAASRRLGSHWLAPLVVLLLLQLPWPRWLAPGEGVAAMAARELVFWLMTAFLLLYVLRFERRPLRSLGLKKPDWRSLVWAVAGTAAAIAGMAFVYIVVFPADGQHGQEQLGALQALPLWLLVGMITRAAVFEELYYRGFAIERITEWTGRRWLGATLSLLLFTYAHLEYWGWQHLVVAGWGGIVLTALYLLRRDLAAAMLAHWLIDIVGFLLG